MCLIPVSTIKKVGLSLPVFIKWDDAEYALRAREAGVATVTLPGSAVWHVSWVDKDDSTDWQAFFHARNRLVAALLHSPFARGGRLLDANLATDLRHLVSMQYYALAARHEAYRNVLRGPGGLHEDMFTRLPKTRKLTEKYPDGAAIKDRTALPKVATRVRHLRKPPRYAMPVGPLRYVWLARVLMRHAFSAVPPEAHTKPEAHLAFQDAKWWVVPRYDSVLVSNAEGSAATFHVRDPKTFRSMLLTSLRLRAKLMTRWPALRAQYRDALPDITGPEAWSADFRRQG